MWHLEELNERSLLRLKQKLWFFHNDYPAKYFPAIIWDCLGWLYDLCYNCAADVNASLKVGGWWCHDADVRVDGGRFLSTSSDVTGHTWLWTWCLSERDQIRDCFVWFDLHLFMCHTMCQMHLKVDLWATEGQSQVILHIFLY